MRVTAIFLLCATVALVAYAANDEPRRHSGNAKPASNGAVAAAAESRDAAVGPFKCDGRQYCSQMKSCAEAKFFLRNCPDTKMDGDHDGIPCEDQHCGHE